ncbi:ISLre2 family transposase [Streptococcus vestibularis]|uniref:ISLre2 family transposase n=1 Tax=Streptococcus vestibularis TaxID=1343 RepID=UPI00232FAE0C|nr:ISLre2 family transposase [Streptococcus vestibularis]MDB6183578.1 ISLre2 family transposase [Streptococcus vestibularis]MDB6201255.1 ISLre2 family transposase [Streptococcus vestibularis]MDB6206950.1 ISLre2 family transposase [Streptococcus vestibularis]MDB6210748.1 ISLre2 family transposase [Streptococcus vestibularis]MDB6214381.1 ISLre2 family transposase [Streptococcus vestibularis]
MDERQLKDQCHLASEKAFLAFVARYDEEMTPIMKSKGYTCIHSISRTVAFTFGEMTFKRKRWRRGTEWVVPVDDYLGLKPRARISDELMYQIAYLATMMPYEKVISVVELTYKVSISVGTVVKAVKQGYAILQEREDYRFYEEGKGDKKEAAMIYIEGDGVMIKARDKDLPNRHVDLSHFIVHTGCKEATKNRFVLQEKKEFVGLSNHQVRDQVLDYLYNTFELTEETILLTNSDGGHGYTPYIFKEIAKALGVARHEHFWDAYHVNKKLKDYFNRYAPEMLDPAFEALEKHSKKGLITVLDTTESLLSAEEELEQFESFKRPLLQNFQFTKSPKLRGLDDTVLGVMETQHRKITYRMKKRGMYWTTCGASAMSQMILLAYEGKLRELFFGSWRKEYQQLLNPQHPKVHQIRHKANQHKDHTGVKPGHIPSQHKKYKKYQ